MIGLEPQFYHWVLPILFVQGIILSIACKAFTKEWFGTAQILLAVLGLYWALSGLWVEALMSIWYPEFDYMSPMNISADARPGRYVPYCDVSARIKCSTVMTAPFNRLLMHTGIAHSMGFLDWANGTLSVLFYVGHIVSVLCECCKKKKKQPTYYRRYYDDDDGCCECLPFRSVMVILTGVCVFFNTFTAYKGFIVMREISIPHCCSYLVNLCLIPSSLKNVKEADEDKPKRY